MDIKHVALIIITLILSVQIYKYRYSQNRLYRKFLYELNELSLQEPKRKHEDLNFLIGFEAVKYYIYKKIKISTEHGTNCFHYINGMEDFNCALFIAKKPHSNLRYYVNNRDLYKNILNSKENLFSERLSGSGVNFLRYIKRIMPNSNVIFIGRLLRKDLNLLPNNVEVISLLDDQKQLGLKRNGLIYYLSETQRAIFDRVTASNSIDELELFNHSFIQKYKPHSIIIGRFALFRNILSETSLKSLDHLKNNLRLVPSRIMIHHQLGKSDSLEGSKALLQTLIPFVDSIDMDLIAFHQLHSLLTTDTIEISNYLMDIQSSLTYLKELWKIMRDGPSFSAQPGMRKISRFHLRAHDYHILMVVAQSSRFYMNLKHALAKGLMARMKARCGMNFKELENNVHFYIEDQFLLTSNLSHPITCFTQNQEYEVCISPTPTCINLKNSMGEAESSAAAALVAQLKPIEY